MRRYWQRYKIVSIKVHNIGAEVMPGSRRYFWAVIKDGWQVVCLTCLHNDTYTIREWLLKGQRVKGYVPIYINQEWEHYSQCCICGVVIEYVTLVPDQLERELAAAFDLISSV